MLTDKCNGNLVLEKLFNNEHEGTGYDFFLVLGLILLGLTLILGCSWHYFNQSRCQKVVLLYQTILMIGIALTYISIIFWYKRASSDSVCQSRMWLTSLGYALILVINFFKFLFLFIFIFFFFYIFFYFYFLKIFIIFIYFFISFIFYFLSFNYFYIFQTNSYFYFIFSIIFLFCIFLYRRKIWKFSVISFFRYQKYSW